MQRQMCSVEVLSNVIMLAPPLSSLSNAAALRLLVYMLLV